MKSVLVFLLLLRAAFAAAAPDQKADIPMTAVVSEGLGRKPVNHDVVTFSLIAKTLEGGVFLDTRGQDPQKLTIGGSEWPEIYSSALSKIAAGGEVTIQVPAALAFDYDNRQRHSLAADTVIDLRMNILGIFSVSLNDLIGDTIRVGGVGAVGRLVDHLKQTSFAEIYATPNMLSTWGNGLLYRKDDIAGACALFALNTELFPDSVHAELSFARAYIAMGNPGLSASHFRRAIEIAPSYAIPPLKAELQGVEQSDPGRVKVDALIQWIAGLQFTKVLLDVPIDRAALIRKVNEALPVAKPDEVRRIAIGVAGIFAAESDRSDRTSVDQLYSALTNDKVKQGAEAIVATKEIRRRAQVFQSEVRRELSAPLEWQFTSLTGEGVDLSKLRGKVVLLHFWAVWAEERGDSTSISEVRRLEEKFKEQGLAVIGVCMDTLAQYANERRIKNGLTRTRGQVDDFLAQRKMTWPQYWSGKSENDEVSKRFAVRGMPSFVLLNANGILARTYNFSEDAPLDFGKLESDIQLMFADEK